MDQVLVVFASWSYENVERLRHGKMALGLNPGIA
jgi:hypothetical protein